MTKIGSTKLGGSALVVGGILALIGNILHPRAEGGALGTLLLDVEARLITQNIGIWYPSHIALTLFPPLAMLGFLIMYGVLREKEERLYSAPGFVAIALGTILLLGAVVLDGFLTPMLALDYVAATGTAKEIAAAILGYNFLLSLNLIAVAFSSYTIGVALVGGALVRARIYNKAVGWSGLLIGAIGIFAYVAGVFGAYWVSGAAFPPYAVILTLWAIILGILLYRTQ